MDTMSLQISIEGPGPAGIASDGILQEHVLRFAYVGSFKGSFKGALRGYRATYLYVCLYIHGMYSPKFRSILLLSC